MDDDLSPLDPRLAPDLTPDELIEKCRRRQREWAQLRREFEAWLRTHPSEDGNRRD